MQFATVELAQKHVADIKARRLPEIEKVEQEVKARLKKEINYWDSRAFELQEEEKAGKKTRLSWQNAQRRAEDLAERLKRRQEQLEEEKFITAQPPRIRGGMVVIPRGLLEQRRAAQAPAGAVPTGFAEDPAARREIELAAMEAVMQAERALGNVPTDVSAQKIGYDIASFSPATQHLRFIEVKGRIDGADTVMITRQEVITSLHEPEKYILAIVQVENGFARAPRYVRGPLDDREPRFDQSAIQYHTQPPAGAGRGARMTKPYKKKLIEVAIPLAAINAASARDKSIRHGHPSTLHLWWARRPLPACRAVLFTQLVDDPTEYVDRLLADPQTRKAAERGVESATVKASRSQGGRQRHSS